IDTIAEQPLSWRAAQTVEQPHELRVCDDLSLALARLPDVGEHRAIPLQTHVPLGERRHAVAPVFAQVLLRPRPEQTFADEPQRDGARGLTVPLPMPGLR